MTRHALLASALSIALLWTVSARAQPIEQRSSDVSQPQLVLTKESEEGFRGFMDMVHNGKLGPDIRETNISVSGSSARLELLRESGPNMVLRLSQPSAGTGFSRYFDVQALENASANDCARVGKLLDEVFTSSPFEDMPLRSQPAPDGARPASNVGAETAWQSAWRALQFRLMLPASLRYTIAVIILTGVGLLASIVILCMPAPTLEQKSAPDLPTPWT